MAVSIARWPLLVFCACTRLNLVHAGCGTVHYNSDQSYRYPAWADDLSFEEQVTVISAAVYEDCDPVKEGYKSPLNATHKVPGNFVAGWENVYHLKFLSYTGEPDLFDIFKKGDECAFAFTGTDAAQDFVSNFDIRTKTLCGYPGVHRGFAAELEDLLVSANWSNEIHPYLSNNCSGGVSMIGHSLGGAQATLLAACANNGSRPFNFTVKAVYTHGAPALSTNPLPNNEADDQCFAGYRWYNHDMVDYDLVTGAAQKFGFHHPYVPAARLSRPSMSDTSYLEVHTYDCKSHCTTKYPNDIAMVPSVPMHLFMNYWPRIRDAYTRRLAVTNATCPPQSWFRSEAPEAAKSVNNDVSRSSMTEVGGALVISALAAFV